MQANGLAKVAKAVKLIEFDQIKNLYDLYGTRRRFRGGMAYHHLDHGLDFGRKADHDARLLVARGLLPDWAPFAGRLVALFHDHVQNEDEDPGRNEDLSAEFAMEALRRHPVLPAEFDQFVLDGIDATKFDFVDGRIIQNARPGETFKSLMADADLWPMAGSDSTHQVLGYYVEMHRHELDLPERATLYDANPDRDPAASWLLDQVKVRRNHRYLSELNANCRVQSQLEINADELQTRAEAFARGDLTWEELIDVSLPLEVRLGI